MTYSQKLTIREPFKALKYKHELIILNLSLNTEKTSNLISKVAG